jgi:hypothetical protein
MRWKEKFHSFKTDGVSVSILFEIEGETKKGLPKKRKQDTAPPKELPRYDVAMGVNPGLRYLFVAKSDKHMQGKKGAVRMSSNQYYNNCKIDWKNQKQKWCCQKN